MDEILKQTLRVALIIRDSQEAIQWRNAWASLSETSRKQPSILTPNKVDVEDYIIQLRKSDAVRCRPLLFILLAHQRMPDIDVKQIKQELNHSKLRFAYQNLIGCCALSCQIFTFLRKPGSGYPHKSLVYTLPDMCKVKISSNRELPWQLGESLLRDSIDARLIGLEQFIPSVSLKLADRLNDLTNAIKKSEVGLKLEQAYRKIEKKKGLKKALHETKIHFKRKLQELKQVNISSREFEIKMQDIAQDVYANRGSDIQAYVQGFLEYERLIERIYWLISQLVIYEVSSCLTSSVSQQLQQINLCFDGDVALTALTQVSAKTLEVGQLVHIELSETDHIMDGLYQIKEWQTIYQAGTECRASFHAQCLWRCQLKEIQDLAKKFSTNPIFLIETTDLWGNDGWMMNIINPDGELVDTISMKNSILSFDMHKTMYL